MDSLTLVTGPMLSGKTKLIRHMAEDHDGRVVVRAFKCNAETEWAGLAGRKHVTLVEAIPHDLTEGDLLVVDEAWVLRDAPADAEGVNRALASGAQVVLASANIADLTTWSKHATRVITLDR